MKLISFKQYVLNEKKEVFFTFGRMNPPTIGHGKLLDALSEMAGKHPYRVYLSHSHDPKKNPLLFEERVKASRKIFPRHGRAIRADEGVRDVLYAASKLYEEGFKRVTLVVGEDRLQEMKTLLNKYNGKSGKHGYYMFEGIRVASAGHRDPDADGAEGASATKLRESARSGDFVTFSQGLPKTVSNSDAKKLYNDVRIGMGLTEDKEFRNHVKIAPVSEIREKYVQGKLFNAGDSVRVKGLTETATLVHLGSNYVVVETKDGKRMRKWLNDVEKIQK